MSTCVPEFCKPGKVGLYRTSRPVRKSGKFSRSGLSGNRTSSFPDAGVFTLLNFFFSKNFFSRFFFVLFQIHPNLELLTPNLCPWTLSYDNPYFLGKMFKNISPDSVLSGKFEVRSCPVRKLICSVRLSPTPYLSIYSNKNSPKA